MVGPSPRPSQLRASAPSRRRLRAIAALVGLSTVLGCGGTTYVPRLSQRIDVPNEARIDLERLHFDASGWTAGAAPAATVELRTEMPPGTRLLRVMLASARLPSCSEGGQSATSLRLDDSDADAGVAPDVSGVHRVTASFDGAVAAVLSGPIAIDWYDRQADGTTRCGRVPLVDPLPDHGWENVSRWSWGFGFGYVAPLAPVADVRGLLAFPLRLRRRVSERGALVATAGAFAVGPCRKGACATSSDGAEAGAVSVPLGLGYDHVLVHARHFQFGGGARYEAHFVDVPLESGATWRTIHDFALVPRIAFGEPRRSLSGLPGNPHGTSFDLEIPLGVWMYGAARELSPAVGGVLTFNGSW